MIVAGAVGGLGVPAGRVQLPVLEGVHGWPKIVLLMLLAVAAHLVVRGIRWAVERLLAPANGAGDWRQRLQRSNPKFTTLALLITSALTFAIYFTALGLILGEASGGRIHLGAYLASASIVGLAVAFGSQGLVQDVVLGLTLVFSDACDVGDVVEIGGQVGYVDRIGLRFTTVINDLGETIFIPNRNIGVVGRYRDGSIRLLLDVQLPAGADEAAAVDLIRRVLGGLRQQFPALILGDPEILGTQVADAGGWRFTRIKLLLWPGQGPTVEAILRPRLAAELKRLDADYADWMVSTTYRIP